MHTFCNFIKFVLRVTGDFMQLLIILSLFILVLVFHVEFDTLKKYIVSHIDDVMEDYKRESASISLEEFYNA